MAVILVLALLMMVLGFQIRGHLIEQLREEIENLKRRNAELMKETHRLNEQAQEKKNLDDLLDEAKLGGQGE